MDACLVETEVYIDDYMDYYNKERYQWELAKLSPDEFYQFVQLSDQDQKPAFC